MKTSTETTVEECVVDYFRRHHNPVALGTILAYVNSGLRNYPHANGAVTKQQLKNILSALARQIKPPIKVIEDPTTGEAKHYQSNLPKEVARPGDNAKIGM